MRQFIDQLKPILRPVMFFSANSDEMPTVDDHGLLLSDFDQAVGRGRYVFECEINYLETASTDDSGEFRVWNTEHLNVLNIYDTHCPDPLVEDVERMRSILDEFAPEPGSHLCLVTGKLARTGLDRVMTAIRPEDFTYEIRVIDIAVAAWLTTDIILEHIGELDGIDVILLPGKTQGDVEKLQSDLGVKVHRGPGCYSELPEYLERAGVELTSDVVRPHVIMIGEAAKLYAEEIASTYEIPLIRLNDLVRDGAVEGDETALDAIETMKRGEEIPHFLKAEIIRAGLINAPNGWVMVGYPQTLRDITWLVDMKVRPDAVVVLAGEPVNEIISEYKNNPAFVEVTDGPDAKSELYTKLEAMFQRCVSSNI